MKTFQTNPHGNFYTVFTVGGRVGLEITEDAFIAAHTVGSKETSHALADGKGETVNVQMRPEEAMTLSQLLVYAIQYPEVFSTWNEEEVWDLDQLIAALEKHSLKYPHDA